VPDDIASIISRAVETKAEYDIRLLAQQLGTNYRSLMYWLRGERPMPAHLVPRICVLLNNYRPWIFWRARPAASLSNSPNRTSLWKRNWWRFPA
jgi:hypothetical protein